VGSRWRRSTLALGLGIAALAGAFAAALGPAEHVRARFAWPPHELPAAQPARLWYAPLLLARHEPESISARVPCGQGPALRSAARPLTLLATAPASTSGQALAVTRSEQGLQLEVGTKALAAVPVERAAAADPGCAYDLLVAGGRWTLRHGRDSIGGALEQMPTVVGLFTALDLRSHPSLSVEVTTRVYSSRGRTHQVVLWSAAALAALAALLLVAVSGRPRRPLRTAAAVARRAAARAGPVDALVAVVLGGWWLIGPAYFDDGWRMASQTNFPALGGFSTYYSSFGVGASLDWVDWVEHRIFQGSTALLVLRLPALACLAATWVLCRWIVHRAAPSASGRFGVGLVALASGFIVGALAWGMTFRPEPVVALLVTGAFASTVLFLERETPAPLVLAAVLVVLAVLAHPAGIVALAPLLLAAPRLLRWARPRLAAAATIVVAAVALLAVLAVVGSDVQQRRADVISLRTYGDEVSGWRDELTRYSLLSRPAYGAPLRREWVALAILAVLAYLLRRRRDASPGLLGLPAASLGVGLLLLIATPSKLPWHFGALIGLAAVAIAAETTRLREEGRRSSGWHVRPFVAVGAAMLVAAWSWFPRNDWADLDLRTLHWTLGIEDRVTLAKVAGAAPLVVLIGLALFEWGRRRDRLRDVPWRAASWTAAVLALPLVAFTIAVLAADTVKTHSWTLARQNVETLTRDLHCGLADDAVVPTRSSMRALPLLGAGGLPVAAAWLPQAPVDGLPRFALGPPPADSPWFRLPQGRRTGLFVTGVPGSADALALEWGRARPGGLERLAGASVEGVRGDDARPDLLYWRFLSAGSLPSPPPEANAVRFLAGGVGPGSEIGLTAPVTYEDESLAGLLERNVPSLALPNLLAYVPCVQQPRVAGVAEVPRLIVAFRDTMWPLGTGTSPFDGVSELHPLVRLPLSDSDDPPGEVVVYEVDARIDGGVVAPAVRSSGR
jgi:arabinosyltransferase C